MSVHRLLIPIISLSLISGCASIWPFGGDSEVKPITVQRKAVERARLNIKAPEPLKAREFKWVIITPDNAEQVWAKLKEEGKDLVLFALTDEGYEELAMTMGEIKNYLANQRSIIIKYKEYYEPVNSEQEEK